MKASWEKIEKNQVSLSIEVEESKVTEALDKAFKKVVQKVNIPGFRKGKVPRPIFEKKFGVESLYQDALDIILPEAYMEAIKETGIDPIDRPEVDVETFAKGQALKFTVKVAVKPEVALGEYKGIEIEAQNIEVNSDEVEKELIRLQDRHAELAVIEDGPAATGDTVIIDFEGFVDDVPFEGGKGERYKLELGSGSFIPGYEEQVVGMTIGEEKDVLVTFPENYQSEDLKGKDALFKVKLHEIKRKILPALDDEFAKDVSEFDTIEEFKQDIETNLKTKKEKDLERNTEMMIVEKAASAAEVEVPDVMVASEVDQMLKDFGNRLQSQGMNMEMYYQFSGQNEDTLREQMHGDASKRVRNNLVLEAIAKAENITASEEELTEELEVMAKQYNKTLDEVRDALTANGSLSGLQNEIAIRKTVQFLIEHSKTIVASA